MFVKGLIGAASVAFAAVVASPAEVPRNPIAVSILASQPTFARGAAVSLLVTIKNDSSSSVSLFPGFSAARNRAFPDTVLLFDLIDPDGAPVGRDQKQGEILRRMAVAPTDFTELPPGWYYGGPIYLNRPPFAYSLSKPGKYRVRARVLLTAREWLENVGKNQAPFKQEPLFIGTLVEDGEVQSNETTFEISP